MQIIVDDLAVNYRLSGKGKTVVLLHGWADNLHTFDDLSKRLSDNYQVLAVDLPGFGGTQPPKTVWGLDDYCQFLANFFIKLQIKLPYAIIGHSNGGALAIRGIASEIISSDKLILLASAGIRNTNKTKKTATKLVAKTGKAVVFWLPNQQKQKLRKRLYGTIGSDMLVVPQLQETFKKTVSQDVQNDASKLNIPVLLIFADKDPAIPIEDGRIYNQLIKDSTLKVINGSDHFIHHDQQELVESLIMEFLKK